MFDVLLAVAISFTITYFAIPAIITVAERKKLFDVPDERKIHLSPIPSLGGLGIFAGFVLASLITIPFQQSPEFQYYFAAALVIFFLGIKDDILVISPIKKFIGQVLAAYLIIDLGGVQIKSMHGFMGIYDLPQLFSIILTYFTVLVIINSFNLIDGVDGLAGSLGVMVSLLLGTYFLAVDIPGYAILAFATAGSLIAFLIFNFQPAKIFMGDTGSMLIGLVTAILVIKFINISQSPGISYPMIASPAIGFTILMIPLLDTLRVFGIRIFNRRSPFSPDRNHVHHLLLDRGLSHKAVTVLLVSLNLLFVLLAYLSRNAGCTWMILAGILTFFSGIAYLYLTRGKSVVSVIQSPGLQPRKELKTPKIVALSKESVLEHRN